MNRPSIVLIVGAGLYGATCAYELSRRGHHCIVIEKGNHVGGNCYTERRDGIDLHLYGPHIFHTKNLAIWRWINQFAQFNHYRHRVRVKYGEKLYSFPPNLNTFNQLWGVTTPSEARSVLARIGVATPGDETIEKWALSHVGSEIYETFIRGYTQKQWHRSPSALPASIIKRIPVRFTYDDSYFDDPYQGIPISGYTEIFEQLLAGADVRLNTDYFECQAELDPMADVVIYTGPIDRFFGYRFGRLEYLSVHLVHERLSTFDFQGIAQMNYTAADIPYTRIVEHKHFVFGQQDLTWITREYPVTCASSCHQQMYPVRDQENLTILKRYELLAHQPEYDRYVFGGRLAEYRYYDMHQVIAGALKKVAEIDEAMRFNTAKEICMSRVFSSPGSATKLTNESGAPVRSSVFE